MSFEAQGAAAVLSGAAAVSRDEGVIDITTVVGRIGNTGGSRTALPICAHFLEEADQCRRPHRPEDADVLATH